MDHDPGDTGGLKAKGKASDKDKAKELLAHGIEQLAAAQDKLYAQDSRPSSSSSRRWTPPGRTGRSST